MNINEIKELILWMKANKVRKFKNADFDAELSDLAFIDELNQPLTSPDKVKEFIPGGSNSLMDTMQPMSKEEEDELLYWSGK